MKARTRIWRWLKPITIVTLVAFLGCAVLWNSNSIEDHDRELTVIEQALDTANERLESAGLPTVPTVLAGPSGDRGQAGDTGPAGRPPTASEVGDAVANYCVFRNDCIGPAGPPGPASIVPGPAGADGQDGVDGVDGTNGLDSTVPGPPGADSTVPGPAGAPGVSFAGLVCEENGDWTVQFSDGTTSTIAGPCRVDVITIPTEGPIQ